MLKEISSILLVQKVVLSKTCAFVTLRMGRAGGCMPGWKALLHFIYICLIQKRKIQIKRKVRFTNVQPERETITHSEGSQRKVKPCLHTAARVCNMTISLTHRVTPGHDLELLPDSLKSFKRHRLFSTESLGDGFDLTKQPNLL